MQFLVAAAGPELAPWVSAGLHIAFDSPGTEPLPCHFPALAEGGLTVVLEGRFLVLQLGGFVPLPAGFLGAARALPLTLYRTPRLRCVGLRLQPAGAQALLRSSPAGLPQQLADAADVFGPAWAPLHERLAVAGDPGTALAALLAFAREWLRAGPHLARAQRALRLQHAALRLASPQEALGLSLRQFEREFGATFGLRPKQFQRVVRVERLLRDALGSGRTDAALALHHGYYDQSHLARDLREFLGVPLRPLLQEVRQPDSPFWTLAVGTRLGDTQEP